MAFQIVRSLKKYQMVARKTIVGESRMVLMIMVEQIKVIEIKLDKIYKFKLLR